jgi:AI-2 transport protein TqsA
MDAIERERRIQTVCLLIISAVAVAVSLYWLSAVMIPFVLAVFFSFGLTPFIDLQVRVLRMPRSRAVLATMALGFLILSVLASLVSTSLSQLTANAGVYQTRFEELIQQGTVFLQRHGVDPARGFNPLSVVSANTVGSTLMRTTNAILGILSQGMMVMIFLFFLLIGRTATGPSPNVVWQQVEGRIRRYIVTKVLTSAATGLLVGAVLTVLRVDLALVFGLFAFLLNFIPNVGSIIATLLPLPVVLMNPDASGTTAFLAFILPAAVQFVIGTVIEPNVMGSSLELHPVTILLALVLWGTIWGIVGMLLATPITAAMKILFERLELTAPLAHLLAGRLDGAGERPVDSR